MADFYHADAVRCNLDLKGASQASIEAVIKDWLRTAKSRCGHDVGIRTPSLLSTVRPLQKVSRKRHIDDNVEPSDDSSNDNSNSSSDESVAME
jgi:hypothetical protein